MTKKNTPKTRDLFVGMRNGTRQIEVEQLNDGRLIYYIEVGNMPPQKAEEYIMQMRNKIVEFESSEETNIKPKRTLKKNS